MSEEIKSAAEAESPAQAEPVKTIEAEAPKARVKNTLENIEKRLLDAQNNTDKIADFNVGDTIKVYVKIVEGDKQRVQPYVGVVIAIKHGGNRKTFMVRRISYNVAIERVFPYHSPFIEKIELVRRGRVRRSKLYYLRGRFGRSAVVSEKVS